jgi:hypothetical protein
MLVKRDRPVRSCGCARQRNAVRERSESVVRCAAYRPGVYNHRRIAVGEVFDVKLGSFCSSWMRRLPADTPLDAVREIEDVDETETPYLGAQGRLERRLNELRPFQVTPWSRTPREDEHTAGRATTHDDEPDLDLND